MDQYEWDEAKDAVNRRKHGIGFDAIFAFDWSTAHLREDLRFDYGEHRLLAYGRIGGRGYAVVYVRRGDSLRIISLRPAHDKEMKRYGL